MKILFLANKVPWPLKDGGAIGTFSISYGLALAGADVDMLAINTQKHFISKENIPKEITNKMSITTVDVNTDIKLHKLLANFVFSSKPYISERFYCDKFNDELIKQLSSNNYDVVILEMLYLASYIPTIREHSNAHITMRAPNIEHEIWTHIAKNTKNIVKRAYLSNMAHRIKNLELDNIESYDSLIPVSEINAETYRSLGVKVPIIRTTTGVFLNKLPVTENQSQENSFCHIGALDWMPNLEGLEWFISNVWPLITKEIPNAKFYIAGRNAPENANEKFQGKNIIFLGEVPDAYQFIQSKSILVVPLLSGSGMRVKIIEGLAMGSSIVSTVIGAEGIDLISGKHIEITSDKAEFASACIRLFKDPELRKSLGENGKEFVKSNYDNIRIAQDLLSFYKKTLS